MYAAAGTLRAVGFDIATLEVLSDPVPVIDQVMMTQTGAANYAVSRNGTLVYVPGWAGARQTPRSLVWVDRKKNNEVPIKAPHHRYTIPRLSPDGTRVALEIRDQDSDIWIWDLVRETLTRLTADPSIDQLPVWTPDSRRIIYSSNRSAGVFNLYSQAADGTGAVDRLTTSANAQFPTSMLPNGTGVVGHENLPKTGSDVVFFRMMSPRGRLRTGSSPVGDGLRVDPLVETSSADLNGEIAPNGRYLAYTSNESGRLEVYVRPFPKVDGGRWQVSNGGGSRPAWARSGRELFYLDASNRLTVVPVQTTGITFGAGKSTKVFDTKYATPLNYRPYDVSLDDHRLLMIKDSATDDQKAPPATMVVALSWFEELKARVAAKK